MANCTVRVQKMQDLSATYATLSMCEKHRHILRAYF